MEKLWQLFRFGKIGVVVGHISSMFASVQRAIRRVDRQTDVRTESRVGQTKTSCLEYYIQYFTIAVLVSFEVDNPFSFFLFTKQVV